MKQAIEASTNSTYMPAAPMAARCQRLGSIHESETLQYKQGVRTRNMTPISWHSPPKCLQERPWPNSCRTLVTHNVKASHIQFCARKKEEKAGSGEWKTSNCTMISDSANSASVTQHTIAGTEKNQRMYG